MARIEFIPHGADLRVLHEGAQIGMILRELQHARYTLSPSLRHLTGFTYPVRSPSEMRPIIQEAVDARRERRESIR